MPSFRVPVVDISSWVDVAGASDQTRAHAAAAMDAACCTVGFVQVVGHGIGADVLDSLTDAMDEFFALPTNTKSGYGTAPGIVRGYHCAPSYEAFDVGTAASEHPGLDLPLPVYAENVWPTELPRFETRVRTYFDEAARAARTLTRIFAAALDLPADFFTAVTDHSVDVLRMDVATQDGGAQDGGGLATTAGGRGAHTDPGIVTVLWADQSPGLQIVGVDEQWHDVMPAHGALLVNLGCLMARWTNDEWRSTPHRVLPSARNRTRRRRSAAFHHCGNVDAVVRTIPSCVPMGHRPTYPPIVVGEHLATIGG